MNLIEVTKTVLTADAFELALRGYRVSDRETLIETSRNGRVHRLRVGTVLNVLHDGDQSVDAYHDPIDYAPHLVLRVEAKRPVVGTFYSRLPRLYRADAVKTLKVTADVILAHRFDPIDDVDLEVSVTSYDGISEDLANTRNFTGTEIQTEVLDSTKVFTGTIRIKSIDLLVRAAAGSVEYRFIAEGYMVAVDDFDDIPEAILEIHRANRLLATTQLAIDWVLPDVVGLNPRFLISDGSLTLPEESVFDRVVLRWIDRESRD